MVSLWCFFSPRAKLLFGLQFRRECPGIIRGAGTDSKSSTGIARWRFGSRVLRNRVPCTLSNKTKRLIRNGQPLVCYAYFLVDTFRWTGARFGDTFSVTATILVYNSIQTYSLILPISSFSNSSSSSSY